METKYETLAPEEQARVKTEFDKLAAEQGLTESDQADLAYLLGMRPDLPKRS